ncbi:Hydrocephalus-inducing protein [Phytophthora cinnamomi]|uniref:Hydrocephalus-inducing protein n=1 Tax=Phytophthora cinnamomi TaxID=4785 RepID=UPI00355A7FCE|nr:Hydrocephalus-inducing protein [Phytophthora cinnamomi]
MQFYSEDYRSVLDLLEEGTNRSDPYAVRRACAEFKRLVLHRNAVRHAMVEQGRLLPALVDIVADHVHHDHGAVLADCCYFLQRLISHTQPTELDIQSTITEAGYLGLLTKGLTTHPHAQRLYTEVCRLVAVLCFDTVAAPHGSYGGCWAFRNYLPPVKERRHIRRGSRSRLRCHIRTGLREWFHILATFSKVLRTFSESLRIAHCIFQALFQLMTTEVALLDDVVDTGMLQQAVELLDSRTLMQEYRGITSFTVHWHIVKFLEICIRDNDSAKEAFCSCAGPAVVVHAMIRRRQESRHAEMIDPWALQYISCMLLCRFATAAGDPPVVDKTRAKQLVQSSAHQLALDILRSVGIARLVDACDANRTNFWAAVEQAVRLLELIAALEANRVPLTRLGASRQVKLIYNNPDVATNTGLLLLCERAVANIEGT